MSVVVTKIFSDHIHIAADSATSSGDIQSFDSRKLFEVQNMVVGGVGMAAETSWLRLFLETHHPKTASEDEVLFLFVEFRDWVSNRIDKKDYALENAYHFIVQGRAFSISHLYVAEITNYHAIGSGRDVAYGALFHGHAPPEAVSAACQHNVYCGHPVVSKVVRR